MYMTEDLARYRMQDRIREAQADRAIRAARAASRRSRRRRIPSTPAATPVWSLKHRVVGEA